MTVSVPGPEAAAPLAPWRTWLLLDARERAIVLLSAMAFYAVLAAYYVLRPIRDELAVFSGAENLPWLFLATLGLSLGWSLCFSRLSSDRPRRAFVPLVLRGFAVVLVVFLGLWKLVPAVHEVWLGRAFYVFVSAFNLFMISLVWSVVVDSLRVGEGRLLPLVGAGGTLGAASGSLLTAALAQYLPVPALLFVSVLFLEVAVRLFARLFRRIGAAADMGVGSSQADEPLGGDWRDAVLRLRRSPYLLGIAGFIGLFTIGSTFLYALQTAIVEQSLVDRVARREYFATLDLLINAIALVLQLFVTGTLIRRMRLGVLLAVLPVLSLAGFLALSVAPVLVVFAVFHVSRRSLDFAIMRPAREHLFLPVERIDKYKTKSLLDAFVYRLGDQMGVFLHAGLVAIGVSLPGTSAAAVPVCLAWLLLALWLGARHDRLRSAVTRT